MSLKPFKDNKTELFGYKKPDGAVAIKPQFDDAQAFHEGMARVWLNNRYGCIDEKGKWVIPAKFELMRPFSEGLAGACVDGEWGFIDRSGQWAIRPRPFKDVYKFENGFVIVEGEGFFSGVMTRTGKMHLPTTIKEIPKPVYGYRRLCDINKGVAFFDLGWNQKTIWFEAASDWSEGLIAVKDKKGWGLMDSSLKIVHRVTQPFDRVEPFEQGLARASINPPRDQDKWIWDPLSVGFISKDGKLLADRLFDAAGEKFICGCIRVKDKDHWGFLTRQGRLLQDAFPFDDVFDVDAQTRVAMVRQNGLWGYLGLDGEFLVPPTFESSSALREKASELKRVQFKDVVEKPARRALVLTPEEQAIAKSLAWREDVLMTLKWITGNPVTIYDGPEEAKDLEEPSDVSLPGAVLSEIAEPFDHLLDHLRRRLPRGYQAYFTSSPSASGSRDTIVLLKNTRWRDLLILMSTESGSQGARVEATLTRWDEEFGINVLGASFDWVELRLKKLPADLKKLARQLRRFSVDTYHNSVSEIVKDLQKTKTIFLWWD